MKKIKSIPQANITGEFIRKARIKAGLTQQELSAKLELEPIYICRGSISRIENGTRAITDIELAAIAKVLNISLDELFGKTK